MCISEKIAYLPLSPDVPLTSVRVASNVKSVCVTHCYGKTVELQCLKDSKTCRAV